MSYYPQQPQQQPDDQRWAYPTTRADAPVAAPAPATHQPGPPAVYQGGGQPQVQRPEWATAAQGYPHQQAPPPASAPYQQINVVQQIVEVPRGVNHLLHFVLTICTGGVWGIVWIIVAVAGRRRRA